MKTYKATTQEQASLLYKIGKAAAVGVLGEKVKIIDVDEYHSIITWQGENGEQVNTNIRGLYK